MDKSSITFTRGKEWWLERVTLKGRQRYPKLIRVGELDRERVVRCRDCKNYRPAEDDEHEDGCALAYAYLFETSPDGFCAWGERGE